MMRCGEDFSTCAVAIQWSASMPSMAMQTAVGLATHSQMSKMRMRKQTQERESADFANAGVRLDAPWSVQPHRWQFFNMGGNGKRKPVLFFQNLVKIGKWTFFLKSDVKTP